MPGSEPLQVGKQDAKIETESVLGHLAKLLLLVLLFYEKRNCKESYNDSLARTWLTDPRPLHFMAYASPLAKACGCKRRGKVRTELTKMGP